MQVRNEPLGTAADYLGTLEMRPDDARLPTYALMSGGMVSPTLVTGTGARLESVGGGVVRTKGTHHQNWNVSTTQILPAETALVPVFHLTILALITVIRTK
jgi:hypothetical protein